MKLDQYAAAATRRLAVLSGRSAAPPQPAAAPAWDSRRILIGLMVPMGMTVLNLSMFGVALPAIRSGFAVDPDQVAWLVTAYTLPFVLFMPLYGRLGDGLGKSRLFVVGIAIFSLGTLVSLFSLDLRMLMFGRVLQGIGTAGVNPLCIALITDLFPPSERGRALGTWSSTGPATSMIGPFLGGFLVDHWGWRAMFVPGLLAAAVALYVMRGRLPVTRSAAPAGFLRSFDWVGLCLLSGTVIFFMFFLSSRPITGVEPLHDWRLLLATAGFAAGFYLWERRFSSPLIDLSIFARRNFSRSSLAALTRMFMMSGEGFLIPLYFTDIYDLNASQIGFIITLHAGSLLITVRRGSRLADRRQVRTPILVGFGIQIGALATFGLLPAATPLAIAALVLIIHGLGAGLSLAVLSQSAMSDIPQEQSGSAAGLYSMIRFAGSILGTTLGGVLLALTLERSALTLDAYQAVFWFVAGVGVLGFLLATGIRPREKGD